jgi:hypothetical protein
VIFHYALQPSPGPGSAQALRSPPEESNDVSAVTANAPSLQQIQQISLGPSFDQLFFSHFYDYFGSEDGTTDACSWLQFLPELATSSQDLRTDSHKDNTILQLSIRAPCMALYGLLVNDQSYQIAAYKWYAISLRHQRSRLKEACLSEKRQILSIPALQSIVVPPVMMCYFEIITGGRRPLAGTAATGDPQEETLS